MTDRTLRVDELGYVHNSKTGQRRLVWCLTHAEPAWIYEDDSVFCWHDTAVEERSEDHELAKFPAKDKASDDHLDIPGPRS